MAETWDAYDKQFNKIENVTLVRGEAIPDGMYHLVCEIIVKHNDGTYLLDALEWKKNFMLLQYTALAVIATMEFIIILRMIIVGFTRWICTKKTCRATH